MRNAVVLDLADCTEFRQTLQAQTPRLVHGTVLLLTGLLGAGLLWAALTKADLVVRAGGRVRPVTSPRKVFNPVRGEGLSSSPGGRVAEVQFRVGEEVKSGDVLIRFDTERLDNEIAKRKRTIEAGEEELAQAKRVKELSARQFAVARAKAGAEVAQAEAEVRQAKDRQAADVRLAEIELAAARDDEARLRRLAGNRAVSDSELAKGIARTTEAKEKLAKARLPVDEGRVEVLRQALALVEKEYAVKEEEQERVRRAKQAEVDTARLELANLELERRQAVLRAPMDGVVTGGEVKVGDLLEPGKAVIEIAEQKGFRFEVLVPSEEIGHLQVGMPARVKLDAYDYQKYGTLQGTVVYLAPDSGVPEGHKTAVYAVKIEVEGEEVGRGDLRGRVKLGMAGQAEIVTARESLLSLLVKKIRQTISLG